MPLLALVLSTPPGDLVDGLRHPLALAALRLSLLTTSVSLALTLLLGTPLAWWMARHPGPAERVAAALVQLPIVVPPAVSGLALLLAFGRRGLLGPLLDRAGWALPFTTAAVVLAELFVSVAVLRAVGRGRVPTAGRGSPVDGPEPRGRPGPPLLPASHSR